PDELVGYVSPQRLLEKRQTDAGQPTATLRSLYLLAQAQAEAGQNELALSNFKRVADSPHLEHWSGRPIRVLAQERRHELLLDLARRAEKRGVMQQVAGYLQQAAAREFPVPLRLRASVHLAEARNWARQPSRAVAAWQAILLNDELREGVY